MRKKFSLVGMFVGGLIIFVTLSNTKIITNSIINNLNYVYTEKKYKNIEELDSIDGSLSLIFKSNEYTLYCLYKDYKPFSEATSFYLLNNKTGEYEYIPEFEDILNNDGIVPDLVGYDDGSNILHFRSKDSNSNIEGASNDYYYDLDTKVFTESSNNYRIDDNITFQINIDSEESSWYMLNINHSKNSSKDFSIPLMEKTSKSNDEPYIKYIYNSFSDDIVEVSVVNNSSSFDETYYIDLSENSYWTATDIESNEDNQNNLDLITIRGNYFIYTDHIYDWTKNTTIETYSKASFYGYNTIWSEPLYNYSLVVNSDETVDLINFKDYNELTIYSDIANMSVSEFNNSKYTQDDKGNFFILEENDDYSNSMSFIKSSKGEKTTFNLDSQFAELISANENNIVNNNILGLDKNDNVIKNNTYNSFGIILDYEDNFFFDENSLFIDNKNLIINIENSAIHYVYVDDEKIEPLNSDLGIWSIDLNSSKFNDDDGFKIEFEFYEKGSNNFTFWIFELIDYMPKISVKNDAEDDIERNVYSLDEFNYEYKENLESGNLVDGFYYKFNKYVEIYYADDDYIDSIYVNGREASQEDIDLMLKGTYKIDNSLDITDFIILDKFGKEWEYQIYTASEPEKYWTENEEGIETARKAKALDINYEDDNAYEAYKLSWELMDTIDLAFVDMEEFIDSNSLQESLYNNSVYNSRIPINQYTPNQSIPGLTDSKGNTDLSFKTWYEHWIIDAFDNYYFMNLEYGDIEFIFDENSGNEFMNLDNQSGHLEATSQGIDSKRVVGSSESSTFSTELFESAKLSVIQTQEYLDELDMKIEEKFDSKKFDDSAKFSQINNQLNEAVYQALINYYVNYQNQDGYNWKKVNKANYSINHLSFKYYDQNGKSLYENTLLSDIETIDIEVQTDGKGIFVNSNNMDEDQIIYNYNFDFISYENFFNRLNWIIIIILFLLLLLFILVIMAYLKNKKNKKMETNIQNLNKDSEKYYENQKTYESQESKNLNKNDDDNLH